ncbi:MAG: hypothetical protein ACI9WU_005183, partial [Myxococcota bacterium]
MLLICPVIARAGIAVIGIDAVGHGPFGGDLESLLEREAANIPRELVAALLGSLAQTLLGDDYEFNGKPLPEILDDMADHGLWRALFVDGRSEDLDGDGVLLSGDSYFLPNTFELAGNHMQTVIDNLALIRLVHGLDQSVVPAGIDATTASAEELMKHMMVGDLDADGTIDFGGPDAKFYAAGTSLGGFHTSTLTAVEPLIRAAVPIVSGGGMIDVMMRTDLSDAVDNILAEPMGPAVVACPIPDLDPPEAALTWNNWSLKCRDAATISVGESSSDLPRVALVPGGIVTMRNLRLLEDAPEYHKEEAEHSNPIDASGGFSITVAADIGDPLELVIADADGAIVETHQFEARRAGLGRLRNSPRLRRLVQVAQSAMDFGDPLAWAPLLIREPLAQPKNILHIAAIGDTTVPFSTMVAFDRAVGLLGLDEKTALQVTREFTSRDAFVGPQWDIEDIQGLSDDSLGPL